MENKKNQTIEIVIPEGCFDGNCYDCRYADFSDKDKYDRVSCCGGYGGYNHPQDRNGCFYFKEDSESRR